MTRTEKAEISTALAMVVYGEQKGELQ